MGRPAPPAVAGAGQGQAAAPGSSWLAGLTLELLHTGDTYLDDDPVEPWLRTSSAFEHEGLADGVFRLTLVSHLDRTQTFALRLASLAQVTNALSRRRACPLAARPE